MVYFSIKVKIMLPLQKLTCINFPFIMKTLHNHYDKLRVIVKLCVHGNI